MLELLPSPQFTSWGAFYELEDEARAAAARNDTESEGAGT